MIGGYITVDMGGVDLTLASSATVSGLNGKIKDCYAAGVPVIAGGIQLGSGTVLSPVNVSVRPTSSGGYIVRAGTYDITITSASVYSVTDLIPVVSSGSAV